mgnify:CR=1 FL=1
MVMRKNIFCDAKKNNLKIKMRKLERRGKWNFNAFNAFNAVMLLGF